MATANRTNGTRNPKVTAAGRRQLAAEKRDWARVVTAVGLVLDTD